MGDDAAASPTYLIDLLETGLSQCIAALRAMVDRDWSARAGTLDWTCWQTVDHVTDCLFSYGLQIAGRVQGGWLKLQELHAQPEASPSELLDSLDAVGNLFVAIVRDAPADVISSDGYFDLQIADWIARALNEALLHTFDVLSGLGASLEPSRDVCAFVLATPTLWMYDGVDDRRAPDPWSAMLVGSGRSTA
ncbi:MAG TPA: DinB family protein [Acidimicrobiia bacterium]|nr:DinB family protein [Acidimicrobiia bacterium]